MYASLLWLNILCSDVIGCVERKTALNRRRPLFLRRLSQTISDGCGQWRRPVVGPQQTQGRRFLSDSSSLSPCVLILIDYEEPFCVFLRWKQMAATLSTPALLNLKDVRGVIMTDLARDAGTADLHCKRSCIIIEIIPRLTWGGGGALEQSSF